MTSATVPVLPKANTLAPAGPVNEAGTSVGGVADVKAPPNVITKLPVAVASTSAVPAPAPGELTLLSNVLSAPCKLTLVAVALAPTVTVAVGANPVKWSVNEPPGPDAEIN